MIVLDASAAALALLNDGEARRIALGEALAAPHLVDAEVAHTLRRQTLRGALDADSGRSLLLTWARLGVRHFPLAGLLPRMWELRDAVSAYDASYIALAEALGCALVTADARLARAPGPACAITVIRQ